MDNRNREDRYARLVAQSYRHQLVADFAVRVAAASGAAELAAVTAEGALAVAGADRAVVYLRDTSGALLIAASCGRLGAPSGPDERVHSVADGARPEPETGRTTLPVGEHGVLDVLRTDLDEGGSDLAPSLLQLTLLLGVMLERSDRYEQAVILAEHDPLTGLLNRRRLTEDLTTEVELSRRGHGSVAFVLLDVDHFKLLNDRLGHAQGDHALRRLADAVRSELRATDTAYRFGGEEFAVLLRLTDAADGEVAAERLRVAIALALARWRLTVSLGIAALPGDALDADALVHAADLALYAAKEAGRDRLQRADSLPAPVVRLQGSG